MSAKLHAVGGWFMLIHVSIGHSGTGNAGGRFMYVDKIIREGGYVGGRFMQIDKIIRECARERAVKTAPRGLRATKSAYAD